MSALVAASIRTSTRRVRDEPRRSNSPAASTRSNFACCDWRHVRDLVEKQGAAVGELEAPHAVGWRIGERAAHVAEQLALEHRLGDAARVHRHHRPAGSRRQRVDRLSDEPFAGAVLARDEDVRIGRRRPLDELDNRLHRGRSRDQRRRAVEAQAGGAFELAPAPQCAAELDLRPHDGEQPRVVPRLLHEIMRAPAHRFYRDADACPGGEHDDRKRRVLGVQPRQQVQPFLSRRRVAGVVEIDQRRVEVGFVDRRQHRRRRRHGLHLKTFALEEQLKRFEDVALVVGQKDAWGS